MGGGQEGTGAAGGADAVALAGTAVAATSIYETWRRSGF